ncbi:MAG TPA: NADP-dependent oxidoreductase [Candidatus Saccharimonadales bacterium]|nr:NADP-dependent oxidoreductase [Candidatus Saccharimonadales bacterium]
MKAARITEYGDPSVMVVTDIDKPEPGNGQVLVRVHASSINPFDSKLRSGMFKDMIPLHLPAVLGGDIAGEVVALGGGVDSFAVGDKVFGQAAAVAGNSGAFAEFAATKAGQIAKMPDNLSFTEAASLPLVGVSALQALTEHIKLTAGQTILIIGGSGGIGSIAVQIAKHIGARVVTTATGDGVAMAKQLGADEVIDYKTQDYTQKLHDVDAVFDTAGQNVDAALRVLKKGGTLVSMVAPPNEALAKELGVTAMVQGTNVTTESLNKLSELVAKGVVTPHVDKVYKLDAIVEAFKAKENGVVLGKVVIEVA